MYSGYTYTEDTSTDGCTEHCILAILTYYIARTHIKVQTSKSSLSSLTIETEAHYKKHMPSLSRFTGIVTFTDASDTRMSPLPL